MFFLKIAAPTQFPGHLEGHQRTQAVAEEGERPIGPVGDPIGQPADQFGQVVQRRLEQPDAATGQCRHLQLYRIGQLVLPGHDDPDRTQFDDQTY